MLVVLVLIGLLAGLVGPRVFGHVGTGKVTAAKTQVKMLKGALNALALDLGRFPSEQEGLTLLVKAPTPHGGWRGPYLDGDVPPDPWGQPYRYSIPGRDGQPFALYSLGADGKPNGSDLDADIGTLPQGR